MRTFGGDFELKILRMRGFSSRFWLKSPVCMSAGGLRFDVESRRSETEQMLYTIATA